MRAFLRTVSSPLRRANSSQPDASHASRTGGDVADFATVWADIQALIAAVDGPSTPSKKAVARLDALSAKLDRLIDILTSEAASASAYETGPCLEYAIVEDVFSRLVDYALEDEPLGSLSLILRVFDSLVATLGYSFLAIAHRPVDTLIRGCSPNSGLTPPFTPHTASAAPSSGDSDADSASRATPGKAATPEQKGRANTATSGSYAGGGAVPTGFERLLRCPLDLSALLYTISARVKEHPSLLSLFLRRMRARKRQQRFLPLTNQHLTGKILALQAKGEAITAPASHRDAGDTTLLTYVSDPGSSSSDESFVYERHNVCSSTSKPKHRMIFPLFTALISMVHREGRVGDSARSALLVIVELAFGHHGSAKQQTFASFKQITMLRKYVSTSGFADVLAAGIGAVYASLPHRLCLIRPDGLSQDFNDGPSINASSGLLAKCKDLGIATSRDTSYRRNSALLVKLLIFSRTICLALQPDDGVELGSRAVLDNILDAFSIAVLKNAVQPDISMLVELSQSCTESYMSMEDEALFTALASKLDAMLTALPSSDSLGRLLSTWLLDDAEIHGEFLSLFSSAMNITRSEGTTRFHASTAEGWLHLLLALLTHHGPQTLHVLGAQPDLQATCFPYRIPAVLSGSEDDETFVYPALSTNSDSDDSFEYPRIETSMNRQMEVTAAQKEQALLLMQLAAARRKAMLTADDAPGNDSFLVYLQHAELMLRQELASREWFKHSHRNYDDCWPHRLSITSEALQAFTNHLRNFLTNTPRLNLILLESITTLTLCPYRSLSGWLLPVDVATLPYLRTLGFLDAEVIAPLQLSSFTGRKPSGGDASSDCLLQVIMQLSQRIDNMRVHTPGFEVQLQERRVSLAVVDGIRSAVASRQTPVTTPSKADVRNRDTAGSFDPEIPSSLTRQQGAPPSAESEARVSDNVVDNILILQAFIREIVAVAVVRAHNGVDGM